MLRANYGQNPWQDRDQVVTSVSWVSRIEDARDSLLRSRWDLVIVDEAHKMSAYAGDKKTLAYQLGEKLSEMTDHFLLMTATPHKGDPENFCLFLSLLDRDVYGNIKSLQEAMRRNEAPFYLRRTKEALVTFPDPDTGHGPEALHQAGREDRRVRPRRRRVRLLRRPHPLRRRPVDQGREPRTVARGRAIGFTMAMLQRRMASTIYAVRRSLERMRDKRQKILDDPEAYRKQQIEKQVPDDFDELPEDEQQEIIAQLEDVVASVDPAALQAEIASLTKLIDQARGLEKREVESKLTKLKSVLQGPGLLRRPEEEAPRLHRAQGLARLPRGRRQRRAALRQAPRVGPHRHPDPRRHEDRRPRHAGDAASTPSGSSASRPRCSSPPRPPAKVSTSSSARR